MNNCPVTTPMYRRPKFLEILLEIRRDMAHEADYDVDLFAEIARSGKRPADIKPRPSSSDDAKPAIENEKEPKSPRSRKPVTK